MAEEKSFKYVIVGGGVAAVLRGSGNLRIDYSMAEKRQSALIVSRNGDGRELYDLDESEIERIGGKDEDDEELIEGHPISSSSPERWDVLGLGQAMVCEKSLTSATGGPNSPLSSSFVRAKMLSSGFLIRPCDGGGSITTYPEDQRKLQFWPDKVLGVKPHADGSAFTLLLPDKDVEGLQFLKDGKWYKAPIVPDTVLINVGDQIEIMRNGIYKSPVHRVVTNIEKERIYVATFCIPGPDKEIQPANGLVSEARPRLYKTVKKYVELYFEYYQQGRRPIEAALI